MITFKKKLAQPFRLRRALVAACLLLATVLSTGLLNPTTAVAASPAEALVSSVGNRVIKILASNSSISQQERQFRSAFLSKADIGAIGRFTLGRYARAIKPSQRKEFHRLLGRFIVRVFIGRMRGTKSNGIKVVGITERKKGRDYLVKSLVTRTSGAPLRVNWRLFRNRSGRLKIFDVSIAGLWLAQEQRSIFVSVISRNGGKISALLKHLKKHIGN